MRHTHTQKKVKHPAANGGKWIRQDKRLAIYLRDGLCCAYCGAVMEQGDTLLTLDHVTPHSLGGSNREANLVTCCKSCNSRKQDLSVQNFLTVLGSEGVNVDGIAAEIRRRTRRSLAKYRMIAKEIMKTRKVKKS